jgi:uncharacterized protein YgfB (UPF0149 family)
MSLAELQQTAAALQVAIDDLQIEDYSLDEVTAQRDAANEELATLRESVRVVLLLCADTSTPADDRIALTLETLGPQAPPEEGVLP